MNYTGQQLLRRLLFSSVTVSLFAFAFSGCGIGTAIRKGAAKSAAKDSVFKEEIDNYYYNTPSDEVWAETKRYFIENDFDNYYGDFDRPYYFRTEWDEEDPDDDGQEEKRERYRVDGEETNDGFELTITKIEEEYDEDDNQEWERDDPTRQREMELELVKRIEPERAQEIHAKIDTAGQKAVRRLESQGGSGQQSTVRKGWIGGTLGLGSQLHPRDTTSVIGIFHGSYQFDRNLITVRSVTQFDQNLITGRSGAASSRSSESSAVRFVEEWGLLYSRVIFPVYLDKGKNTFSLGGGAAYIARRRSPSEYGTFQNAISSNVGLALETQFFVREFPEFFPGFVRVMFKVLPIARVGFYGYTNINPGRNIWGGTVGLQLGKFW